MLWKSVETVWSSKKLLKWKKKGQSQLQHTTSLKGASGEQPSSFTMCSRTSLSLHGGDELATHTQGFLPRMMTSHHEDHCRNCVV